MKNLIAILLTSLLVIVPTVAQQAEHESPAPVRQKVRFAPLHVYIDTGHRDLAAYQFELKSVAGQIKIVGVEGGEHPAYKDPPYYDPAALMNNRIIIAAFNTGSELPRGKTRIATIHLQIIGDVEPQYELELTVSADADGHQIPAEITFEKGK